jgi:hypothetical protein
VPQTPRRETAWAAISVLSGFVLTGLGFMFLGSLGWMSAVLVLAGTACLIGGMMLIAIADRKP